MIISTFITRDLKNIKINDSFFIIKFEWIPFTKQWTAGALEYQYLFLLRFYVSNANFRKLIKGSRVAYPGFSAVGHVLTHRCLKIQITFIISLTLLNIVDHEWYRVCRYASMSDIVLALITVSRCLRACVRECVCMNVPALSHTMKMKKEMTSNKFYCSW